MSFKHFSSNSMISINNGCRIKFVDCNKEDLCASYEDINQKIEKYSPKAIWVVHIGAIILK